MNEVQQKLFHMLQWYHIFCKEHGLNYYILGGTLLGAIRHKGFIPWDDDIDIGMPRPDYDKFISLAKELPSTIYIVESFDSPDPLFTYPFTKIYDTTTTYVEKSHNYLYRGLYIDIFPLDGIGNSNIEKSINFFCIHVLKAFQSNCRQFKKKPRPIYKKIFLYISIKWFSPFFLSKKYRIFLNSVCKHHIFGVTRFAGNLLGSWGIKEVVPVEYFGTPKEYIFENLTVYGPEKAHEYLTAIYGDYMKLPPLKKRVSDHEFILRDLHKSYLDK